MKMDMPIKQTTEVLTNEQPNTTPDVDTIINTICTQLQLLSTVIKGKGNSHGGEAGVGTDVPSLQNCVSEVLSQAEWFKEMVEEKVDEMVGDMDFDSEVESKVDDWFSSSFSFDDYVDVSSELESKVEEVVEHKLRNASISVDF